MNALKLPENWPMKLLPHVAVLAVAIAILVGYFSPITQGKVLYQSDLIHYRGMGKELVDYRAQHHEDPLWGTRMFSGMPHYQYGLNSSGQLFRQVDKVFNLGLPRPITHFFILFVGFYILLLSLKIDPWLSGIGALAFMFSSFFMVSIEAGHTSKINAVAYLPIVIAGVLAAYRGQLGLGAALATLGMGLEINANHFQITFYLGLIIGFIVVSRFVTDLLNKRLKQFFIASGLLVGCLGMGALANWSLLQTTLEYTPETIRGPEVLKKENAVVSIDPQIFEPRKKTGLKPNYAFQWSNGVEDVLTLFSPYFAGGASGDNIGEGSETYDILKTAYGAGAAKQLVTKYPTYWGELPFTSGPVYAGAIIMFLFILGLIIVDDKYKWWILAICLLAVLLSMGRHFLPLSKFFFNWVPMYDKFRAPSMMLIVAEFALPLLGFLALRKFFAEGFTDKDKGELKKYLFIAGGTTVGLMLLLILIGPALFSFGDPKVDASKIGNFLTYQKLNPSQSVISQLTDVISSDRIALFRMDILRGIALILGAGGLLYVYLRGWLKKTVVYAGLAGLVALDLIPVDLRYVNKENFVDQKQIDRMFVASAADNAILQDRDPNYRVLNLTTDVFQNASTSYFHKSIGGYHAAKLRRYQDMIENHLEKVPRKIGEAFNAGVTVAPLPGTQPPLDSAQKALEKLGAINMLNAKYIIFNESAPPILNRSALGNAWFVQDFKVMESEEDVMAALGNTNPGKTALVNTDMADNVAGFNLQFDPSAAISLTSFDNKKLVYSSKANSEQLAVFSEIYYNSGKGWDAYVDGQPAKHFRVNYLLRAMRVPAGSHTIEFRFEPKSYFRGNTISMIVSLLALAVILGGLYWTLSKGKKEEE